MFDSQFLFLASGEAEITSGVFWALLASAFLIILNGFYVAYEFAIIAGKRSAFEAEEVADRLTSKAALRSFSDLSMQLAGAQLGITMASLALGRLGEPAFESIIEVLLGSSVSEETARLIGFSVSLSVFTFLHLVIGEMVPKNIALAAPDATLRWLVLPYRLYLFIFRPFALLLNSFANVGCRLVGISPRDEILTVHTVSELSNIVSESTAQGTIEADDGELLKGVLEFSEREVADIMLPLSSMVSVRLGATIEQVEEIVASSGQVRIPVLSAKKHAEPIGYVHAHDFLESKPSAYTSPFPASAVRQMVVVQSEHSLIEVLRVMRRLRRQLAVVVDKTGSPVGVVSLEQLIQTLHVSRTNF